MTLSQNMLKHTGGCCVPADHAHLVKELELQLKKSEEERKAFRKEAQKKEIEANALASIISKIQAHCERAELVSSKSVLAIIETKNTEGQRLHMQMESMQNELEDYRQAVYKTQKAIDGLT